MTVNGAIEQVYESDESASQQNSMFVGGIPLSKIKELVTEAISAAEHHKHQFRRQPVMASTNVANYAQMKANQQSYGSANSVMWDDETAMAAATSQQQPRPKPASAPMVRTANFAAVHPMVKQVLHDIAANPNHYLQKAEEIKPSMGPIYAPIPAAPSTNAQRQPPPAPAAVAPVRPIQPMPVNHQKSLQLSGLLQKGFFAEMSREASLKI